GVLVNDLLVSHFPDLISVDFTAAMEERLDAVAEGQLDWVELLRDFYGPFERTLQQADMAIEKVEAVEPVGRNCPECGAPLIIRWGRYGKFIGCSAFPACRYTEPWLEKIGVTCPQCHVGDVVLKHTKKGRIFYGCSTWPKCDFMSWKRPLAQPCPVCGGLLLEVRKDAAQCQQCQAVTPLETVETPEPAAV
ncbi:MAG: DNA topoisomerase I, partial [Chloroflexi bacterium]|nr:DNA topoisomerase I [Chloroflexota bacterium]